MEEEVEVVVRSPDEGAFAPSPPMMPAPEPILPMQPMPIPQEGHEIIENKPRENKRYQASKKNRELTESLKNENTYLQGKLQQMETVLYSKELQMLEADKAYMKLREDFVNNYVKQAREMGDEETADKARDLLLELKLEKKLKEREPLPQAPILNPISPPQVEDERIDNFKEFQKNNPWIDPNSELYNEKLAKNYLSIAQDLDGVLAMKGGKAVESIGTYEYYEAVGQELKDRLQVNPTPSPASFTPMPEQQYQQPMPINPADPSGYQAGYQIPVNQVAPQPIAPAGYYNQSMPPMPVPAPNYMYPPQPQYYNPAANVPPPRMPTGAPQAQHVAPYGYNPNQGYMPSNTYAPAAPRHYGGNFRYK